MMTREDINRAVTSRHSVRAYQPREIEPEKVAKLQELIGRCNAEGALNIQLITNEPQAFGKSFMAHYGKFSNVTNYLCMVGPKRDDDVEVRLGYYGEQIVILAQSLGLNSCWVGLTYSKKNTKCEIGPDEKIYALIALGYGATQGVPSKSKRPEQICEDIDRMPDWFRRGVDFALLAPSAINQQKFRFALMADGRVKSTTSWGPYAKMDLGIARYHFELGAERTVQYI